MDEGGVGNSFLKSSHFSQVVSSCHSAPLHRPHHLLLPERHLAGEEGAREGGEVGGDGQDWNR